MQNPKLKMSLNIPKGFQQSIFDYLMAKNKYNYYNIEITLKSRDDYKYMTEFMTRIQARNEEMGITNKKIFSQINIECKGVIDGLIKFLKKYFSFGYDFDLIKFLNTDSLFKLIIKKSRKTTYTFPFIDMMNTWIDKCHLFDRFGFLDIPAECQNLSELFIKPFKVLKLYSTTLPDTSE
mmetsp:Transcript_25905/g.22941  ORF Transcript_25905/g.22941 Transcript_25905/m.22941 type:complete len:179 (+) Transcript_25905:181-717(+)